MQGLVNLSHVSADTTGVAAVSRALAGIWWWSITPAASAGTILLKDKSHTAHERFWEEVCTRAPEEQASIPDFYQYAAEEQSFFQQFPTVLPACKPGQPVLHSSCGPDACSPAEPFDIGVHGGASSPCARQQR